MSRKAEERGARKAASQAKFEDRRAEFVARTTTDGPKTLVAVGELGPSIVVTVNADPAPRIAANVTPGVARQPKSSSRYALPMTWCITVSDTNGAWSWNESRAWTESEWKDEIAPKLREFAGQTWSELDRQASGTGHKMHHGHELDDIVAEAQARWLEIGLEQFSDSLFRFRVGGRKRIWGYVVQAHFHTVWWDRTHGIYPVG